MKHIPLTKGLNAIVDDEDFDFLSDLKWYASRESRNTKWYAITKIKGVKTRMHRLIMGLGPDPKCEGPVVDHINHDSLDNRKSNLELISQSENMKRSPNWKKKGEKYPKTY